MSIFKIGYKKVSANEALIITGSNIGKEGDPGVYVKDGRMMRVVRGGSVLVTPFQIAESVSLNSMQIKLTTPRIVTNEGVPIRVWATATIKIADELDAIVNYAEQFLGKTREEISNELKNVLEGNLRTIVAKLTALEVNNAREQFVEQVREIAQKELTKMGFSIVSLVLDDVKDDDEQDGYLVNLGAKTIAESKRNAEIARSDAQLEVANKLAENRRSEQLTADATAIATNESVKMRQLKEEKNKREIELNRSENEEQVKLKQTEIDKTLKIAQIEATKVEQEGLLAIKETQRQVKEQEALIHAQDDKIRAQTLAEIEVINAEAEAKVFEANARAKAAAIEAQGRAEAEAIRLRGLAEAEAIAKKAEAMQQYGQAAVLEMLIKVLPDVARAVSEPLSNIGEVKVFDLGGEGKSGMQQFAGTSVGMLGVVQDILKETTGISMKDIVETNASYGRNQLVDKEAVQAEKEITLPYDEEELVIEEPLVESLEEELPPKDSE